MLIVTGLFGMDQNSIYLSPAPLYHAAPLRFNMMAIILGGTSIIMESFDAEEFLGREDDRPFCLFISPHQPHQTIHRPFAPLAFRPCFAARLPYRLLVCWIDPVSFS